MGGNGYLVHLVSDLSVLNQLPCVPGPVMDCTDLVLDFLVVMGKVHYVSRYITVHCSCMTKMPWGTNTYLSPLEVRIQIGVGSLDVSVFITLLFCESVRFPARRPASRKGILERGWRGLKKYDNWGCKITTMNHY